MGKRIVLIAAAAVLLLSPAVPVTKAELSIEEIRQLLQESLTIAEIDREVQRLTEEEQRIAREIEQTRLSAARQEQRVEKAKGHAARVLRSYYMGNREQMWLLLLYADSFAETLSVFEYLLAIAESDRRALDRYLSAYRELKTLQAGLEERSRLLGEIKAQFLAQRDRLAALQAELDAKLEQVEDKAAILDQMSALNRAWQEEGLPLFRRFLQAMSDAMLELPDYIATYNDSLEVSGDRYTFLIRDEQLNPFLQSKNDLFRSFEYAIRPEGIFISGGQDGAEIEIQGHYIVEHEPENALRFVLDELKYNGLALPDTTREDMQRQFEMTFYPKRYSAFMEAVETALGQGELRITLRLSLGG